MARTPVTLLLTMLKAHRTDGPVEAAQADHRDG